MNRSTARDWQTRIRLWAALVMAFFTIANMGFYACGLISPDAMEAYYDALPVVWFLYPLYFIAILIHIGLGLWKVYRRQTFRMPLWEAAQILFGLSLPFVLLPHLLVSAGLGLVFGSHLNYVDRVLLTFPAVAWRYVAVALIIAIHAHIGAHVVLRMRPWYPKVRWPMVVLLVLIPLSAAGGYWNGGAELYAKYTSGALAPDDLPHPLPADQQAWLHTFDLYNTLFFAGLYALVLTARGTRLLLLRKHKTATVAYDGGPSIAVLPKTTILEASRIGRVPHASICGGRGRCTTCRVKVLAGADHLSPVGDREAKALKRIGAAADVRLACQAECLGERVSVLRLLDPGASPKAGRGENRDSVGRDVEVAVLFADLRGFTQLSEGRFPYDVVYILNRYFEDMGRAIEDHEGKIDKFLGDGILAYFGLDQDPRVGCRNAVAACRTMAERLVEVNRRLENVVNEPLALGLGLHFGDVILGSLGYKEQRAMTVIGDTVNTASRLQGLNKAAGSQLVLSTTVAAQAGLDLSHLPLRAAQVRGRNEPIRVYVVKDVLADLGHLKS
jgi:adenylate cyclase